VLRVGFLADDFTQLNFGRVWGLNPFMSMAGEVATFLRPVGFFLAYQVGWNFWGYNPFPYHLMALLAHMASALILGLWLAAVTRKPGMGWLAGACFGVFPLNVEAVGWIAAQFDTFAVLFGLASLLCFTRWWLSLVSSERPKWALYALSLMLYTLAIFTKESLLTFVPIFALSAWLSTPPANRREWSRILYAVLPFLVPISLDVGYRYIRWHTFGGYSTTRTDFGAFIWDSLGAYGRMLVSPLNETVTGPVWVQVVGLLSTLGLLALLTLYGRYVRRLLLLVGVWLAVALAPVLGIVASVSEVERGFLPNRALIVPSSLNDVLFQNRYLYLASAGMIVGVAALLYQAVSLAGRARSVLASLVGLLLLLSTATCWVQLRPWHTASVQTEELVASLLRIIPAQERPQGMVWYSDNIPVLYKGVYMLYTGLGISRTFHNREVDYPKIERVPDATQAPLGRTDDPRDAFALRFGYEETSDRFVVDYAAGVTGESAPPVAGAVGENLQLWDFRGCATEAIGAWQVNGARAECAPNEGLTLHPQGSDPQLVSKNLNVDPMAVSAKYVRLRVSATYPFSDNSLVYAGEWYWSDARPGFGQERRRSVPIKKDGNPHVYWAFIRADELAGSLTGLRFDPANGEVDARIEWVVLDLVR
jgi:hypothetical protein